MKRVQSWLPSLILACITSAAWAIGPGTVVDSGLSQQSSFYYNVNGTYAASLLPKWCVNAHTSTATAAENVALMQNVGASCARVDATNWDQVEQSLGVYTWTASDTLWNAVCGAGINPIFVATYNNTLYGAASYNVLISGSTQITGYSNYDVAALNRLIGTNGCSKVVNEIFNEPNLTQWTTSIWSGQAYAGVAATVAAAAKAAQPGVIVITGGASPGTGTEPPQAWLGGVVGAGASLANFGGYGLHPYAYNEGTPALTGVPTTQLVTDTVAFAQSARSGAGQTTAKPIYITEYGFPLQAFGSAPSSCASPSVCQTQGIYMAYAMLTSVALFVPYFTEYDLIDDGTSYSATDQNTFGMFYNGSASSGNPVTGATPYGIKPQGTAFQSVTGCTAGTTSYNLSYNTSNNVETETFNKSGGACLAIFTWDASNTKSYSANIGTFSSVTCKDVLGNSVSCTYSGGNLSVSVSASVGPVIVTAVN
jgi:hypothetical protein